MNYCSKCGRVIDDDMTLCPDCAAAADPNVVPPIEGFDPQPPKKKVNVKKIAIIAAAVLLIIGAVIACVLIFKPTPQEVVEDAYAKTMEQLDDVFSNAPNLTDAIGVLQSFDGEDKLAVDTQIDIGDAGMEYGVYLSANTDASAGIVAGDFELTASYYGMEISIPLAYSLSGNEFVFGMPEYSDKTYGLMFDDGFVDRLLDSYIYTALDLDDSLSPEALRMLEDQIANSKDLSNDMLSKLKAIEKTWDKFTESLEYESSDMSIPKLKSLDIYKVSYDKDTLVEIMDLFVEYCEMAGSFSDDDSLDTAYELISTFDDADFDIYVGVNDDGYLTAFSLYSEDDDEFVSLVLNGKNNIWESFSVYSDSKEQLTGGFKQTKNGFELRVCDLDDYGIVIACNDKAGKLTFKITTDELDELAIPLYYDIIADGDGVSFELDADELSGMKMTMTMKAIDGDVEALGSNYADILEFTEADYQNFLLELLDAMYGGMLSEQLGDDYTYENVFGDSDVDYKE